MQIGRAVIASSMTVLDLPKDIEAWARAEVAAGRAPSLDALVSSLLAERRAFENLAISGDHSGKVTEAYKSLLAENVVEEAAADEAIDRLVEKG